MRRTVGLLMLSATMMGAATCTIVRIHHTRRKVSKEYAETLKRENAAYLAKHGRSFVPHPTDGMHDLALLVCEPTELLHKPITFDGFPPEPLTPISMWEPSVPAFSTSVVPSPGAELVRSMPDTTPNKWAMYGLFGAAVGGFVYGIVQDQDGRSTMIVTEVTHLAPVTPPIAPTPEPSTLVYGITGTIAAYAAWRRQRGRS